MTGSQSSPVFDPICGMWLEPNQIVVTYAYLGQTYGFCCNECRDLFTSAPEVHVTHLAHEPRNSAGHRCPYQRLANGDSVARPEQEAQGSDE